MIIRLTTVRLTKMWVVDKLKALSVMATTGSQNKIPFMKLQKQENVTTQQRCCQWFKLRSLSGV